MQFTGVRHRGIPMLPRATGQVIVRELAAREKRVRAVNRSGRANVSESVEALTADATDLASMREA